MSMKRVKTLSAAIALIAVISCTKEQEMRGPGEPFSISVSLENQYPATKTYLSGTTIRWGSSASDKVLYVFDSYGTKNVFTRTEPTSGTSPTAKFEGSITQGSSPSYLLWSGKLANSDQSVLSGKTISSLELVNPQTINNTNSFDQTANISVMKYGDDYLRNVFGYIRYTIPKGVDELATIKSVTFSADEALSGPIQIDCSSSEPKAKIVGEGNTSLTVNTRFKPGLGYEAGTIYAVLPPGTYHNMTMTITPFKGGASDSNAATGTPFTIKADNDVVVLRGKYTDAGTLPYVSSSPDWELPGNEWPNDTDAFDYGVSETREASLSGIGNSYPQTVDQVTYASGLGCYTDKMAMGTCTSWDTQTYSGVKFPLKGYIAFKINKPGTLSFIPLIQTLGAEVKIVVGLLTHRDGASSYKEIHTRTIKLNTTAKEEASRVSFEITNEQLQGISEAATVFLYCTDGQLLVYPIRWTVSMEFSYDVSAYALNMKNSILNTENTINPSTCTGTCYYVSTSGNDSNNGLSASRPIKTISKVNSLNLKSGDVVLFKRGDTFRRDKIDGAAMIPAKPGVTYSSYGVGEKPILNGSPYNGAVEGTWSTTSKSNVYVYSKTFGAEVGGIFLNGTHKSAFKRINSSANPFKWTDLNTDQDFFQQDGKVYFYSSAGNPSSRYTSMEFNVYGHIFEGSDNVNIDNLCLRHTGSHGINTWATAGMKITNCEIGLIGGAYWLNSPEGDPTRYGNGVQLYGSCGYFLVENCWVYECFDTGLTHQLSKSQTMACVMENVTYRGNLIENCTWSLEWFLYPIDGVDRMMRNILIEKNICRMAGYGWGQDRMATDDPARHIMTWKASNPAENFIIRNNIFERSAHKMFQIHALQDEWLPVFESNNICIN